jgi:hypothetical protein
MLLLYPGELYRLLGASSFGCKVVFAVFSVVFNQSSESTKKCISRGITLHTVVAHF